jgi:hypothetical protein
VTEVLKTMVQVFAICRERRLAGAKASHHRQGEVEQWDQDHR